MKFSTKSWIISGEELKEANRLDAKFFHPMKKSTLEKLKNKFKTATLKTFCEKDFPKRGDAPYKSQYIKEGVPVLTTKSITETGIDWNEVHFIFSEVYKKLKAKIKENDIVLASTGLGSIGKINIVDSLEEFNGKCTATPKITVIRLKNEGIGSGFLFAYLNSFFGQLQIHVTIRGHTGQLELYPEDIGNIIIPLIPEEFQLKLKGEVEMIKTFRRKARNLQLQLEKELSKKLNLGPLHVKEAKSIIIKSEDLLSRLDPEFYYYMYKIPQILKEYPYEIRRLDELAELSFKRVNPKKRPDKKFRYVEIANLNPNSGEIESWSEILGVEAPGRARMLLRAGNIILSSLKGSLKSIAIVPEELDGSIGTTGFFVLQPKEEVINKESLWWVLRTDICQRQLEQLASGAIMQAINEKELRNLKVPIPPPEIQKEIKTKVEEIQKLRKEANRLVKEAVKEVEKLIEGA